MQEQCIYLQIGTYESLFNHFNKKNDKMYLMLLEILQFGDQFLGMHSILKNAVSTQIKPGGTFTVTSARKDVLKAVSMGLILQGISVPFLWS